MKNITVKQELEFTAEIPYHEGETANVSIERRSSCDSPLINFETYQGRVTMTVEEARQLVTLGELFERAENILKGLAEGEGESS